MTLIFAPPVFLGASMRPLMVQLSRLRFSITLVTRSLSAPCACVVLFLIGTVRTCLVLPRLTTLISVLVPF